MKINEYKFIYVIQLNLYLPNIYKTNHKISNKFNIKLIRKP